MRPLPLLCTKRIRPPDKATKREMRQTSRRAILIDTHCGVCRSHPGRKIVDIRDVMKPYESILDNPKRKFEPAENVTGSYDFILCYDCFRSISKKLGSKDSALDHLRTFVSQFQKIRAASHPATKAGWIFFDMFILFLTLILPGILGVSLIFRNPFDILSVLGIVIVANWIIFWLIAAFPDVEILEHMLVNPFSRIRD